MPCDTCTVTPAIKVLEYTIQYVKCDHKSELVKIAQYKSAVSTSCLSAQHMIANNYDILGPRPTKSPIFYYHYDKVDKESS